MSKEIVLLDLFSGIGGFALGLKNAGFSIKKHYFSEKEKHAIANYKYNFKNAIYVGTVENVRATGIEHPTIVTFGSPCQDFSIAGDRAGLEGQQSVLILEAIRIIKECRPSVFIWENVRGAFSSNAGEDFWAIIKAFANIGGYRLEWQLLNTLWVLPQNRERIYLVGHLAGASGPGVFPITENDILYFKKTTIGTRQSQTKYYSTAISTKNGSRSENTYINVPTHANCLSVGGHSGGLHSDMTTIEVNVNNANGVEKLNIGDSLNYAVQNSKTRRGRIGKSSSQTINTNAQIAVMDLQTTNLRRLTEIECERLQGFPDNHTQFGIKTVKKVIDKKLKQFELIETVYEIPKTARYKLLGNTVTTKLVTIIGKKLNLVTT